MNSKLTHREASANWALGLSGEAGEVSELVKKHLFHGQELDKCKLIKELGDVAWYWTAMCIQMGIDPDEVLQRNVDKLKARHGGTSVNWEIAANNKNMEQK
jgi:NTP pyrophosphatase (non-canonical NTP hydrolase)